VCCVIVARPLLKEVCRANGGIVSGETLCHDIYPARPITTVSLAANTYCMIDGLSSCAPRTVGPRVQFSGACEQGSKPSKVSKYAEKLDFQQKLIHDGETRVTDLNRQLLPTLTHVIIVYCF